MRSADRWCIDNQIITDHDITSSRNILIFIDISDKVQCNDTDYTDNEGYRSNFFARFHRIQIATMQWRHFYFEMKDIFRSQPVLGVSARTEASVIIFLVKTSKFKLLGLTPSNIYLKYDNSSQDGILVTHIASTDRTGEG